MDKKTNLDDYLAGLGITEHERPEDLDLHTHSASFSDFFPQETDTAVMSQDPEHIVGTFLHGLLERIDRSLEIKIHSTEGALDVEIIGPHASKMIGHDGHVLNALEVLAHTVLSKEVHDSSLRIQVDAAGYKRRRRDRLIRQAEILVAQVMKNGEPIEMEPMCASDRRIVHMTVKATPGVTTESHGEGARRRIVVKLTEET